MPSASGCLSSGRIAASLCVLVLVSCGESVLPDPESSASEVSGPDLGHVESGLHGLVPDPSTRLFIVTDDGGDTFPLLVSNSRGYRLTCFDSYGDIDDQGLLGLVDGAGFNSSALWLYPRVTFSSQTLQAALGIQDRNVRPDDLGGLPCHFTSANGNFLAIDANGVREYFLDMNEVDSSQRRILRTVGCGELLRSMGLELRQATLVSLDVAKLFAVLDDKYNINCRKGTPPSRYVPSLVAVDGGLNQKVSRGADIAPIVFRVDHLAPSDVVTIVTTKDECGPFLIDGLRVTGTVSKNSPNRTCETTFVAHVVTGKDANGNAIVSTSAPLTLSVDLSCEINSNANCGACGVACAAKANQTVFCAPLTPGGADFACQAPCNDGWANCDGDAENGCESRLDSLANCGRCGEVCAPPNSSMDASCAARVCQLTCKSNFADCDGNPANGCEADLLSHGTCGSCTNSCNANAACINSPSGGVCQCVSGYQGGGETCDDVDECLTNNGGCSPYANCANLPGTRACTCTTGYAGDGVNCFECPVDASDGTCANGSDMGSVAIGAMVKRKSAIAPLSDVDYYKVAFAGEGSCPSFHPLISVDSSNVKFDVVQSNGASCSATSVACGAQEQSLSTYLSQWESQCQPGGRTYSSSSPGTDSAHYIGTTLYVRVYAASSVGAAACLPYEITFANSMSVP